MTPVAPAHLAALTPTKRAVVQPHPTYPLQAMIAVSLPGLSVVLNPRW